MWVIVHVYVGLAIAAVVDRPWWQVALLVLASHVVLDLVPHWDYTTTGRPVLWSWIDFVASCATLVVCLAALHTRLRVVAMGPLSGAPDFDVVLAAMRGGHARKWFPSHWRSFPHGRCGPRAGISIQVAIVAASAAAFLVAQT
jgi:hypothetical protein